MTQQDRHDPQPLDFDITRKRITVQTLPDSTIAGQEAYFPALVENFAPGLRLPFAIYFPVLTPNQNTVKFARIIEKGRTYSEDWRDFFAQRGILTVYIEKDCLNQLTDYLEASTRAFIESPKIPGSKKHEVLYNHAKYFVEKVFYDLKAENFVKDAARWSHIAGNYFVRARTAPSLLCKFFANDYNILTHSVQVCLLGMAFCVYLQWDEAEIAEFGVAGLFHDLGKVWIDEKILLKPCALTDIEFAEIRRHPHLGYQHLKQAGQLSESQLQMVLQHHEAMDGKGYPAGLKAEQIHRFARVARLIDCYDAITTRKPYKEPYSPFRALKIMNNEMKSSFDVGLLKKFIQFLGL